MKIILVAGARPNFMKIAPVIRAIRRHNLKTRNASKKLDYRLVHTGQHYDTDMSKVFFRDLSLPVPDIHLGVGSGTHARQTAKIMMAFEDVCLNEKPGLVMVVGDVNSTIACALVAVKLLIPVAHVEAGLRSHDRTMPEEINRILTDQISDYLFTTCEEANENLKKEGISEDKIYFVGNVMIDTLLEHVRLARKSKVIRALGLEENRQTKPFALLTLHRPSNVDDPKVLMGILRALNELSLEIPIIFPLHPRTYKNIKEFGLDGMVNYVEVLPSRIGSLDAQAVTAIPPQGYRDFLGLMAGAKLVLTDSGGIQEETTILGIPCLTLRNNTERGVTIRQGTNILVGNDPDKILERAFRLLRTRVIRKKIPKYWDGKAARRIVKILTKQAI